MIFSYHKEKFEDIEESFWEAINRMTDIMLKKKVALQCAT
jgi:hypothetical protein